MKWASWYYLNVHKITWDRGNGHCNNFGSFSLTFFYSIYYFLDHDRALEDYGIGKALVLSLLFSLCLI